MLIDDIKIRIAAGHGGKGAVAFNKNLMSLGPAGGTGGTGGDVWAEGVADIGALRNFRFKKEWNAEDGEDGRPQFVDGKRGKDIEFRIPVGTVIHNLTTGEDKEIVQLGERILIAKGGKGGKGNFHFRSSTNTSPKEFQPGLPGEAFDIRFELKLIADVGFIGLPNVGKSSLLNELTNAQSKVANYQFTTLVPHLGAYYGLILADIPGLIEGASLGKGLGDKFLRHVERTRILFHFVSAKSEDPIADYETVWAELKAFNKALMDKNEYIFLSQSDETDAKDVEKKLKLLKKKNKNVTAISIYDDETLKEVKKILNQIIIDKTAPPQPEKKKKKASKK
jgi:GTPase